MEPFRDITNNKKLDNFSEIYKVLPNGKRKIIVSSIPPMRRPFITQKHIKIRTDIFEFN